RPGHRQPRRQRQLPCRRPGGPSFRTGTGLVGRQPATGRRRTRTARQALMPTAGQLLRRLRQTGLYLLLLSPACTLAADADYHIAHGPLAQALRQWSQQSGDALLFDARELKDLQSAGVSGSFTPAGALEKLLQGLP